MNNNNSPNRDKLGLALSGGGFRASLFHLGVLRRMAEMDLLRYVEVLSTVSGGSIIGALYILLLKKHIAKNAALSAEDYVAITKELEEALVAGIQKNLRTRLFMNPFGILRVLVTADSLGRRMARIYERYLYWKVVDQLPESSRQSNLHRWFRPGYIRLEDIKMTPGGKGVKGGYEAYNQKVVKQKVKNEDGEGSVITHLMLNATSLNSGAPFWFSSIEIGDPRLGFFRYDEIENILLPIRNLLHEIEPEVLAEALRKRTGDTAKIDHADYPLRRVFLAHWWRTGRTNAPGLPVPPGWEDLFEVRNFPKGLLKMDFGKLRRMKLAAWYILIGYSSKFDPPITGGLSQKDHLYRFLTLLEQIDVELRRAIKTNIQMQSQLLDFVMELYYLRSAEVMSENILKDLSKLTLGEAVGASACFPPVFPPLVILGLYDDAHVSRLGLTDGGVYDNVGLTALMSERCTHIIASDTSGLFDVQQQSSAGRLGMSGRIVSILMDDIAEQQRNAIRDNRRVSSALMSAIENIEHVPDDLKKLGVFHNLRSLAFFHINSPPVEKPGLDLNLDPELVASLRTDLDGFGDVEVAALMNLGYDTADRYIRKYLAHSPYKPAGGWKPAQKAPRPIRGDISKILRVGRSRLFRALKLGAPVSWIFSFVTLALATVITWNVSVSARSAVLGAANLLLKWIKNTVPWFGPYVTEARISLGVLILLIIAVVIVLKLLSPHVAERIKDRHQRWFRFFVRVGKYSRSYGANVLWLVGWLPIVIAVIGAALAWCSHLFFYLPFQSKTRSPENDIGSSAVRKRGAELHF